MDAPELPVEVVDEPAEEDAESEWLEDPGPESAPDDELLETFSTSTRTPDVLETSAECEVPCDEVCDV